MGKWQLFVVETQREGVFRSNGVGDLGDVETQREMRRPDDSEVGCWLLCFLAQTSRENIGTTVGTDGEI
jgi:hypothetical protein